MPHRIAQHPRPPTVVRAELAVLAGLALLLLVAPQVQASDLLSLSGFGTLGYQADNNSYVAPTRDISQLPRNLYAAGPSWRMDSRLGVQVTSKPNPNVDLVAQVVVRDQYKSSLDSATEFAYVALHPNTSLDLRLGRVGYSAFLMADYRNVGYAYPWVRPPVEFYGWIPIFSVDGVDAAYSVQRDDAVWRMKAQFGKSHVWLPLASGVGGGYQFKTDNLSTFSLSRQSSFLRLKAAYSSFTAKTDAPIIAPLEAGLDQVASAGIPGVSANAAALDSQVSFKGARVGYTTLGAAYDNNTWLLQTEIGRSTSSAHVVPTGRMAYASVGRRFGDWMPFCMVSTYRPGAMLNASAYDMGAALNASLGSAAEKLVNYTRINQTTTSLGVRWDFRPHAALKLQWDSTRSQPPGFGIGNFAHGLNLQSVHLDQITATVDFIF